MACSEAKLPVPKMFSMRFRRINSDSPLPVGTKLEGAGFLSAGSGVADFALPSFNLSSSLCFFQTSSLSFFDRCFSSSVCGPGEPLEAACNAGIERDVGIRFSGERECGASLGGERSRREDS